MEITTNMDGYQIAIYCGVFAAIDGGLTAILGAYLIKKNKNKDKDKNNG
jgi:hypothetical protein